MEASWPRLKRLFKQIPQAVRRFDSNMRGRYHPARLAAAATAVLAIGVAVQLFLPPYLGMSNDGSFDNVMIDTGLAYLHPEDPDRYFNFYVRIYEITGTHGETGTTPGLLRFFVRTAILFDTFFTQDLFFDMRWLAALYVLLYLGSAFLLLKGLLARLHSYAEGLFLTAVYVLILVDAALVTRFASLYTQPLEWILFINIVNAIFAVSRERTRAVGAVALLVAVILLMDVNRYAALAGLVFSIVYWRLAEKRADALARVTYLLMAIVLVMVSVGQTAALVKEQTVDEEYNQMTRGVLFQSTNPEAALAEFGIEPRYSLLTDTYADQSFPVALLDAQALQVGFLDHYSTMDIVIYYARHPMALLSLLDVGIHSSFASRPSYSGNFEKSVGLPARAKSPFPTLWSTFKEQLAPKTVGALLILLMIIVMMRHRKKNPKEDWVELNRSLLDVALLFSLVEMLTVLVMSGDSRLVRESFLMGISIDVLVMIFLTELLYRTKAIGQEVQV